MNKTRLFGIAFLIAFTLTALLCILSGQPLIFLPIDYSLFGFLQFAILIGTLCFCLVFINFPILKAVLNVLKREVNEKWYYLFTTFIVLQIVTLLLGYLESSYSSYGGTPFFYYKGVGNSRIYILTGNITAITIAAIYAKEQIRLKELSKIAFEFEGRNNHS